MAKSFFCIDFSKYRLITNLGILCLWSLNSANKLHISDLVASPRLSYQSSAVDSGNRGKSVSWVAHPRSTDCRRRSGWSGSANIPDLATLRRKLQGVLIGHLVRRCLRRSGSIPGVVGLSVLLAAPGSSTNSCTGSAVVPHHSDHALETMVAGWL